MFTPDRYTVSLPNGRKLDVTEYGKKTAPTVMIHNGTPTVGYLFQQHIENANEIGLHLVTYSRPGYGLSTRNPGRHVADAAYDTAALADALGIGQFAVWGISGGGPHALACAALLGDRVVAAASFASIGPYGAEGLDYMAGMGQDNIDELSATLEGEAQLMRYLEQQVPAMLEGGPAEMADHMRSLLSPQDEAVFSGEFGEELAYCMQSAVEHGIYGWLDDNLELVKPWGFELSQIRVPLQVWQGRHDLMVPYSHGEWYAKQLPQAEAHLSDDDGHLTLYVRRVPEVHEWMLKHFR